MADSEVFGCGFVQSYLSEESKSVAHLSTRLNEEEEDGDHEQVEGQRDPETPPVDHEDEPPARAFAPAPTAAAVAAALSAEEKAKA